MKILSLSLDQHILDPQSVVAQRNKRYGERLERYTILVPSSEKKTIHLSSCTSVYGTGGRTKLSQLFKLFLEAVRLMRAHRYDVVTSQDTYFLGLCGLASARLFRSGLEIQVHGIEKMRSVRKRLAQFILASADSIRVPSQTIKKYLIQEIAAPQERITIVPVFVDVAALGLDSESKLEGEYVQQREQFKKRYQGRFNIVSINRLVPIKNIPLQLEVVQRLKEEFPHLLLHIVGEGPERESLQRLIDQKGLEEHVVLHGARFGHALHTFYTQADCFILTSNFEGYGMVVVEAAAFGCPIVMTDVGCAGDVVKNRESALIVPPSDAEAFARAVREVVADPDLREQLKEKARHAVESLADFETVMQKYLRSWEAAKEGKKNRIN